MTSENNLSTFLNVYFASIFYYICSFTTRKNNKTSTKINLSLICYPT